MKYYSNSKSINWLFVAFLFLGNSVFSQNVQWDILSNLFTESNPSFIHFNEIVNAQNGDKQFKLGEISISLKGKTNVNSNTWHEVYDLYHYLKKRKPQSYHLIILRDSENILYSRLLKKNENEILWEKEYEGFAQLMRFHSFIWGIEPVSDYQTNIPEEIPILGIACGYGGIPTPNFFKMKHKAEDGKKEEILEMCKSLSPGIRCLGGIGLKYMEMRGNRLSDEEKELLRRISKDQSLVRSCSGCTNWGFYSSVQNLYSNGILIIKDLNW